MTRLRWVLRELRDCASYICDYLLTGITNRHCQCHCTHRATHDHGGNE